MDAMIDFHTHSTASDGTYTPSALIKYAEQIGVTHLALTDHDTTDGIAEFLSADSPIVRVPGIELSVDYDNGELHIAGLFIDKDNAELAALVSDVKLFRAERNEKMLEKLSTLMKRTVKREDILSDPNAQLGRPHMAKYLLTNGVVFTLQEAFSQYLGEGCILNVPKRRISVERAFAAIKSAGGISVLAHPSTLNLNDDALDKLVKTYKDKGLGGIEVYSSHSPDEKKMVYASIAAKHSLAISCGSDFHGGNSKILQPGADIGNTPPSVIINGLFAAAGKISHI